jgi:catechol 2,3-dioxygenase-like lactoylglutathione lyase family enzyme
VQVITGFNHTSFTVSDIDQAMRFWSDVLGFDSSGIVERRGAWVEKVTGVAGAKIKVVHLHGYGHHMEFIQYAEGTQEKPTDLPDRPGVGHVCLEVDDIHETERRLLAAGATALGTMTEIRDPEMTPCVAGYLRDPNGIIIELLEIERPRGGDIS